MPATKNIRITIKCECCDDAFLNLEGVIKKGGYSDQYESNLYDYVDFVDFSGPLASGWKQYGQDPYGVDVSKRTYYCEHHDKPKGKYK